MGPLGSRARGPSIPTRRSRQENMSEVVAPVDTLKQLLDRMVAAKQLSATDANHLMGQTGAGANGAGLKSEEDVLRWLAAEYGLAYTTLDDIEPDRQLLSLFPARLLLRESLLPL